MSGELLFYAALKITGVIVLALTLFAYTVLAERRICAFIQDRIGPNRAGPWGLLQPMADGVKALFKEDFTPSYVRKAYFWIAPTLVFVPAFLAFAVIPFGSTLGGSEKMVIADLNVGILYTLGVVSLGVYGIVLAGYSSNSKYPFLGGIRSSAQMVSYEIAMGMSVVPVFMLVSGPELFAALPAESAWRTHLSGAGDLNLTQVVGYQSQSILDWMLFKQPLAFLIFLVAAFAETNRLPFDMPESETELVGGYNTEYSSMKFAMFFMGEYVAMVAVSALMVTLFLGGWTLPFWGLNEPAQNLWQGLAHIGVFIGKVAAFLFFFIWIRWTLPRFRYDQLMQLGWKRFVPLALANIVLTATILWARS